MIGHIEVVSTFLAILAMVCQVFVAGTVVIAAVASASRRQSLLESLDAAIGPHATQLAFGVASVATLGSLYFSEVANFPPCKLCWYQRIAMYPLVPLLGLALLRREAVVAPYVALLATAGGAVSLYHIAVERFPSLGAGACDPANPCSVIWVNKFGYLTIPTMAFSAFATIVTLMLSATRHATRSESSS